MSVVATDIRPVGAQALMLTCADGAEAQAWRAELWRRRERGQLTAVEIVPGARTVLLDGVADLDEAARRIAGWEPPPPVALEEAQRVGIPVVFDGEDLDDVARLWGVDRPAAVARLVGAELTVAFCGFAPGFAYLVGLPAEWAVPRLATPRARVPAGSVGLAGAYTGIYPTESPGGWRLVGRTDLPLFDVHRDQPALLTPGTAARLVET